MAGAFLVDTLRRRTVLAAAGACAWPTRFARAEAAATPDVFVPARSSPLPDGAGVLTARMRVNTRDRLAKVRVDDLLEPYRHRPGAQEWAGEHVGKFLHASALALRFAPHAPLAREVQRTARALVATQLADGYLGTYAPAARWTSWDVWSHKYNLLGLLAVHDSTGDAAALSAARRIGDRLTRTFGDGPGQLDLVSEQHSTHKGMASTSVLEPMALLQRKTNDPKLRAFCDYVLRAWEQPHGPKLLSALTSHGNVFRTANAKAYEMTSNLVGMMELHRTTGDPRLLTACTNAWSDVVAHRQYVTGTASWAELFEDDDVLTPGGAYHGPKYVAGGEGCVTVTWQQLTWQLLRRTGEARFGDALERTAYNALIGAQSPSTGQIAYFSPLVGRKRYGEVCHGITPDVCCCASSIPRGIALLGESMAGTHGGDPTVVLYEPAVHDVVARSDGGAQRVRLTVRSRYPSQGAIAITVDPARAARFTLRLRVPAWATGASAAVAGARHAGEPGTWLAIDRVWTAGDVVELELPLSLRATPAGKRQPGKVFVQRGPVVLVADENVTNGHGLPTWDWVGRDLVRLDGSPRRTLLVPFSDAGQTRAEYDALVARDVVTAARVPLASV